MTRGTLFFVIGRNCSGKGIGVRCGRPVPAGGAGFWRGALRGLSPRTREGRRPDRPKNRREGEDSGH